MASYNKKFDEGRFLRGKKSKMNIHEMSPLFNVIHGWIEFIKALAKHMTHL
jgi:hypothetical protein